MSGSKYQVAWESEEAPELNFGVLTVVLLKPNLLWFSEREILRKYNFQPASNICNNMLPDFWPLLQQSLATWKERWMS